MNLIWLWNTVTFGIESYGNELRLVVAHDGEPYAWQVAQHHELEALLAGGVSTLYKGGPLSLRSGNTVIELVIKNQFTLTITRGELMSCLANAHTPTPAIAV